ncbi:MAG: hypothetical protein KDK36_04170, partial [Leptospiraceae bacterium]|nr:hypothetical protein [Leptospiraceae bacterium]
MQKIIGIKPLSKVLGFGLLTVLLGHIQFDIPGSIGVKSNFTEIGLLISLGFLKHWIHFVILSLFSCFNVAPDGSLIPETLNHTAGILFLWFYYNKIKDQEENYKFIILMIIGILIYYYLIIIPLIYIIHLILGNIDIN